MLELFIVTVAIIISAQGKDGSVVGPLLGLYLTAILLRAILILRYRERDNGKLPSVFLSLANYINERLFCGSNDTRFTLFRVAPFRNDFIVPWLRYRRGGQGALAEAEASLARYGRKEGVTGRAWDDPQERISIQVFPPFLGDADLMRAIFVQQFGVKTENAFAVSDYMADVTCVLSHTFLDGQKQFSGLLSVDIRNATIEFPAPSSDASPGSGASDVAPSSLRVGFEKKNSDFVVDSEALVRLVDAMGIVLKSLPEAGR